jgi:two-component system LytT family response regulator
MIFMEKRIVINEVVYLKAESNYTVFYFENGRKYVSGYTLKHNAEKLNLIEFHRVNRAYLLNPKFIETIEVDGRITTVLMSNGTKTNVSRRRTPFVC